VLTTEHVRRALPKTPDTVEPVFAPMKFNRRLDRFMRRGPVPCRSEWHLMAATHSLLRLYSRQTALACAIARSRSAASLALV
jgi:hypothetical protein